MSTIRRSEKKQNKTNQADSDQNRSENQVRRLHQRLTRVNMTLVKFDIPGQFYSALKYPV